MRVKFRVVFIILVLFFGLYFVFTHYLSTSTLKKQPKPTNLPPVHPSRPPRNASREELLEELEAGVVKELKTILNEEFKRNHFLKMRRLREDRNLTNKKTLPSPRTENNPIIVNILCGKCRWSQLDLFDPKWLKGCSVPCKFVTGYGENLEKADLILDMEQTGHAKSMKKDPRFANKRFGMFSLEAMSTHTCSKKPLGGWKKCIQDLDMLISYSRYSDVQMTYGYGVFYGDKTDLITKHTKEELRQFLTHKFLNSLHERNITIHDAVGSTWISNCADLRLKYMKILSSYIPLHHYGKCLGDGHVGKTIDKISTQQKYPFNFAFENTVEHDYMSEKFFQGLLSNNVMVYMGSPSALDASPVVGSKVFINALDYTPKQLAKLLSSLSKDQKAYDEYFEWKTQSLSSDFVDLVQNSFTLEGKESWLCKTCEYYHKKFD